MKTFTTNYSSNVQPTQTSADLQASLSGISEISQSSSAVQSGMPFTVRFEMVNFDSSTEFQLCIGASHVETQIKVSDSAKDSKVKLVQLCFDLPHWVNTLCQDQQVPITLQLLINGKITSALQLGSVYYTDANGSFTLPTASPLTSSQLEDLTLQFLDESDSPQFTQASPPTSRLDMPTLDDLTMIITEKSFNTEILDSANLQKPVVDRWTPPITPLPGQQATEHKNQLPKQNASTTKNSQYNFVTESVSMLVNWTDHEQSVGRRIVKCQISSNDLQKTLVTMQAVNKDGQSDIQCDNCHVLISCIKFAHINEFYITSTDFMLLLESIVGVTLSSESKNRFRRSLERFHPVTLTKPAGRSKNANNLDHVDKLLSELFQRIMMYEEPRPRNFVKDIKIYPWLNIEEAILSVIEKYSQEIKQAVKQQNAIQKRKRNGSAKKMPKRSKTCQIENQTHINVQKSKPLVPLVSPVLKPVDSVLYPVVDQFQIEPLVEMQSDNAPMQSLLTQPSPQLSSDIDLYVASLLQLSQGVHINQVQKPLSVRPPVQYLQSETKNQKFKSQAEEINQK